MKLTSQQLIMKSGTRFLFVFTVVFLAVAMWRFKFDGYGGLTCSA